MQKIETNGLYIAGLNIVTDVKYEQEKEIINHKFLKWVIVKNNSGSYMTDFVDIKTNAKYYNSAMDKGELFIDLSSLVSISSFTVKNKVSIEDCDFLLNKFKREYDADKLNRRNAILEIIESYSEAFDPEGKIIDEIMAQYGYYDISKEEALMILAESLELIKKDSNKKR